ncbi:DUF3987 domain-containing protein [Arsukibacterium perlucidum]|uniref:DUF3987 domain-containing protein n=1 Tax=Arsukibacterium perlucidum TaxID=368811 RepID=UPI00037327CD|nr:DUF3987 domain-containing protein [Arsukibacterium perlucidum]
MILRKIKRIFSFKLKSTSVKNVKVTITNRNNDSEWSEPLDMKEQLVSALPVTNDMLSKLFFEYITEQAKLRDNASQEYAAVAVLACAAALIGGSATISPKRLFKDFDLKPTLWAMIIGSPSRMKTPSAQIGLSLLRHALKTVTEPANKKLESQFETQQKLNKAKVEQLEKIAQQHMDKGEEDAAKEVYLEINMLDLTKPKYRRPMINDCTIEALIRRVETNPLGVFLFRDELYGWLEPLERNDKAQDRSFVNEAFNGKGLYEVERISRGNLILENPTLFIMGNIQPDRLRNLISGRASGESNDGLFERFQLAVYPEVTKKQYVDACENQVLKEQMQNVFVQLAKLGTPERYTAPLKFNFEETAQKRWDQWATALIEREGESDNDDQAILGKYGSLVAKIALVLHILDQAEKNVSEKPFHPNLAVSLQALNRAIKWSEFLYTHNLRIRSIGLKSSSTSQSAELLKSKLSLLPKTFAIRDVQRKGWSGLTTATLVNEAIEILEENGYVRQHQVPGQNGKMTIRYLIHPSYRSSKSSD